VVASPKVSLAARLKPFRLDAAKVQFANLEVAPNQTLILDSADAKFGKQVVNLVPKSIDDLKAWIGVSDAAFAQKPTPLVRSLAVMPVHDTYTVQQSATLHTIANDYIFGHSASVSPVQLPALSAWLKFVAGSINLIGFLDIHVAAGARLVVNSSITVLFANNIQIDRGGVIQLQASHVGINCATIQGTPELIRLPTPPVFPIRINQ
jgi:hypothetical protein